MQRPQHQTSLDLIDHQTNRGIVQQRAADGYINATELCKAAGKAWADYRRLGSTEDFLSELESTLPLYGLKVSD